MESFIYADMNRACRNKDVSKIRFYGAFAAALSYIIYTANENKFANNSNRSELFENSINLYRGVRMS